MLKYEKYRNFLHMVWNHKLVKNTIFCNMIVKTWVSLDSYTATKWKIFGMFGPSSIFERFVHKEL